jgi:predicted nucleic acid-binding protein
LDSIGSPSRSHLLLTLSYRLDLAEAEAIALATEINANVVLLDEREGRRIGTQAGLQVTGVLGLLLRAKLNGEIPALKPEIQLLRTRANFFIAQQLESEILAIAGE